MCTVTSVTRFSAWLGNRDQAKAISDRGQARTTNASAQVWDRWDWDFVKCDKIESGDSKEATVKAILEQNKVRFVCNAAAEANVTQLKEGHRRQGGVRDVREHRRQHGQGERGEGGETDQDRTSNSLKVVCRITDTNVATCRRKLPGAANQNSIPKGTVPESDTVVNPVAMNEALKKDALKATNTQVILSKMCSIIRSYTTSYLIQGGKASAGPYNMQNMNATPADDEHATSSGAKVGVAEVNMAKANMKIVYRRVIKTERELRRDCLT